MIDYIDLYKSDNIKLPYLPDNKFKDSFEGKGWSFSYVYHFSELKDIYLAIKKVGFKNINDFSRKCIRELKIKYMTTPWDNEGRRILEQVNALRNFRLINTNYEITNPSIFKNSEIGEEISQADKLIFKDIFFSYYRFKEIMSWFTDPNSEDRQAVINAIDEYSIKQNSKVIYPFSRNSRFTDSFIYELKDDTPIYMISSEGNKSNGGILRFWDVFVKWGQELELIEKFNMKNLDYGIIGENRTLSCVYFRKGIDDSFDLFQYITSHYKSKYISVPKLVFRIAIEFRYKIESIKSLIVKESEKNMGRFSLQRTSEIFLRNTEKIFVPVVDNSYISHILLQ